MSADKKKFLLRIDQQLYDQIATAADNAGNSVNAYIEQALTRALHQPALNNAKLWVKQWRPMISLLIAG